MYLKKLNIYEEIKNHNQKYNIKNLRLSSQLKELDEKRMKVLVPSSLVIGSATLLSIAFFRNKTSLLIGGANFIIMYLVLFCYHHIYFNIKAKKDVGYKRNGNKFFDLFKPWYTSKQVKKQIKQMKNDYPKKELKLKIKAAKTEYEFISKKNNFIHFEATIVTFIAMLLPLVFNSWLSFSKLENVTFDFSFFLLKYIILMLFAVLLTYLCIKWSLLQNHRNKKATLKKFIQTMELVMSYKVKKNKK